MASNASGLEFPNWTAPNIDSLNFASNCTTVASFLKSWFDLTQYDDVRNITGSDQNVTFWVPETLQSQVAEEYFRQALPSDLQRVATYGEILQWEHTLRGEYSKSVREWVDKNDTSLPLDISYFDKIIHDPGIACRPDVCDLHLGYDLENLGDVNGPGVFLYYLFVLIMSTVYSLVALTELFRNWRRRHRAKKVDYQSPVDGKKRTGMFKEAGYKLYQATKTSFSGFSDTAAVFSLALPFGILIHYRQSETQIFSKKDLVLELWVIVYSTCVSIWLYRIGACIRRVERAKIAARGVNITGMRRKQTLATALILICSIPGFAMLAVVLFYYHGDDEFKPFKFEAFWDDFCHYEYPISRRGAFTAMLSLVLYFIVRAPIMGFVLHCLSRRERKQLRMGDNRATPEQRRWKFKRMRAILNAIRHENEDYRNASDWLGIIDVLLLGAASVAILGFYFQYRQQLSKGAGVNSFTDNWGLGQVLAVSALLPVVIGFFHSLRTEPTQ